MGKNKKRSAQERDNPAVVVRDRSTCHHMAALQSPLPMVSVQCIHCVYVMQLNLRRTNPGGRGPFFGEMKPDMADVQNLIRWSVSQP